MKTGPLEALRQRFVALPLAYKLMGTLGVAFLLVLGIGFVKTSKTESAIVKRETVEPKTAVTFTTQTPQASFSKKKEAKSEGAGGLVNMFKSKEAPEEADLDALETLYSATNTEPEKNVVAPYGRLLSCETVLTIDSSNTLTPIVGLVTEDLWYQDACIIPAGTEVHGSSQGAVSRERILADTNWTLVWVTKDAQNGQQLHLKAIALDRDKNDLENTWSILDGAAGIRGTLLKSDELAEMKLFGATFLGGVVASIQQPPSAASQEPLEMQKPSVVKTSVKTATAQGMSAVIERYAERIMETLEKEAFFVRVPAGKQFYLYIQQPIDLNQLESMK